jgi:branched-chain amino acid transport system permease protein
MVFLPGWASFAVTVLTIACIYGLLAVGLNVHFGYTGLLNFGHVAFFAVGAYTSALLTIPPPETVEGAEYVFGLGLPMPWGLPISLGGAAIAGGILAALLGLTSVRLSSHYLAIATFALAGVFTDVLVNEAWLTKGTFGLLKVPKPFRESLGADSWQLFYLIFAAGLLVATFLVVGRLGSSPFGRLLKGVRESEDAARMLGKDTNLAKLKSFAIGGAVAGLAGGVYAHYFGLVTPQQFLPIVTFLVWTAVLLGGAVSNKGVIIGAFLLIFFRESTRFLTSLYDWLLSLLPTVLAGGVQAMVEPLPDHPSFIPSLRFAVIGLLLILVIRYRPQGLLGDPHEIDAMGEEDS